MPALTIAQIAEICGGEVEGDADHVLTGADALECATPNDLSFVANEKAVRAAESSRAGCLLVPLAFDLEGPWSLIRLTDPRTAFARALTALFPRSRPTPSVHPSAVIASTAHVPRDCFIGAHVVIGEHSQLGGGCYIGNGCSIGDRVRIGDNTALQAHVTVYEGVQIGARVIIHSGCVLGADGFGFTLAGDHYEKFPQIGIVEIGDDVEIGANCCIDRAALGVTKIGEGTKLDNLVHVAHNCTIGKHVVVAAQTGFSGSVFVGDYAVIGGQVGIGEKAIIDSRAVVGGKSGVLTSQKIPAREPVWGIPARPLRQHLRGLAYVAKLPEFSKRLTEMKQKLESLPTKMP